MSTYFPKSRVTLLLGITLTCVLSSALVSLYVGWLAGLLTLLSSLVIPILLSPILLDRHINIYQPITLVMLSAFFGCAGRAYYIVIAENQMPDLLFGQGFEYFIYPTILLLLAITAYTLSYSLPLRIKSNPFKSLSVFQRSWSYGRFLFLLFMLTGVGLFGFKLFISNLTIEDIDVSNFSKKRFVTIDGKRAALGYYRLMISFIEVGYYFMLVGLYKFRRSMLSIYGLLLLLLFFLAISFPVFTNTRIDLVILFFNSLLVISTFGKIRLTWLMIAGIIGFVLLVFLGQSRESGGKNETLGAYFEDAEFASSFTSFFNNKNFLGVTKNAHIMEAIPDKLDFQYGKTYYSWILAPIPRTLWPEKPVIHSGPILTEKVYNRDQLKTGGTPPGGFTEMYWNFGVLGLAIGSFFYGFLSKAIYVCYRSVRRDHSTLILYLPILYTISLLYVSTGFSYFIILLLQKIIIAFIALAFIVNWQSRIVYE